jgi:signal transduction histidine kinase
MARDIVQAHGGEIHCESKEGSGTTFWLTFPEAVD